MVINDTSVKEGMSNYESLAELFVDQETKEFLSKWKTGNEVHKMKEFKTSTLTDKEYLAMKEVFSVLKTEKDDYDRYKKAFNKLCKFCNIVPNGTIITKYELSKGKEDDKNNLYVEYTENTRPITLPADTKLYHQSVVGGIKELIPRWKLRGKNENGYLCDKPRIYLTMSKKLPKISTDNKLSDKMHIYEVLNTPDKVFVDPLLPDVFQKAVYVETDKPIPVKEITPDTIIDKAKNLIAPKKESCMNESVMLSGTVTYKDLTVTATEIKNPHDNKSKAVRLDFYDTSNNHIGEVSISSADTDNGFIYDLEVFEKYRRNGYGRKIMEFVLENYKATYLTVGIDNVAAINLYKSLGFKITKKWKDPTSNKVVYVMMIGTGINESARSEEKAKEKKDLSDLEFAYDKKYNAFCLTVSNYSAEKLKNTLAKKQSELDAAKKEKKDAKTRYDRLSAQIKIDHLENVCKKCNTMIKKKESYNNNESK